MMRLVTRLFGGVLLLAATAALADDLLRGWSGGFGDGWRMTVGGELWYRLSPDTLNLTQAVIERYIFPPLWNPVILGLLLQPAAIVLGAAGLIIFVAGEMAGRPTGRRRHRS